VREVRAIVATRWLRNCARSCRDSRRGRRPGRASPRATAAAAADREQQHEVAAVDEQRQHLAEPSADVPAFGHQQPEPLALAAGGASPEQADRHDVGSKPGHSRRGSRGRAAPAACGDRCACGTVRRGARGTARRARPAPVRPTLVRPGQAALAQTYSSTRNRRGCASRARTRRPAGVSSLPRRLAARTAHTRAPRSGAPVQQQALEGENALTRDRPVRSAIFRRGVASDRSIAASMSALRPSVTSSTRVHDPASGPCRRDRLVGVATFSRRTPCPAAPEPRTAASVANRSAAASILRLVAWFPGFPCGHP